MKKYLVEFMGTFFFVLTIGSVVLAPNDAGALAPLAIGAVPGLNAPPEIAPTNRRRPAL